MLTSVEPDLTRDFTRAETSLRYSALTAEVFGNYHLKLSTLESQQNGAFLYQHSVLENTLYVYVCVDVCIMSHKSSEKHFSMKAILANGTHLISVFSLISYPGIQMCHDAYFP